jgi:acyl-CoA thioesterase FadM
MQNNSIIEWRHIVRPGADDCHYRGYLVSGARLLQYVTDCIACLSSVREGTGGLIANINGNFRAEVHAMDELLVELKLERQGNTSRVYAFTITKTIEYANDGTSTAEVLKNPKLVADGTCVLVCKPH